MNQGKAHKYKIIVECMSNSSPCEDCKQTANLIVHTDDLLQTIKSGNPPLPQFLEWIADRLVYVYKENPNIDFVLAVRKHANNLTKVIKRAERRRKWPVKSTK
jgi:hypothetical protein